MRILIALLLCGICSAQEIRRPTHDADTLGLCGGTHLATGTNSMGQAYDAAGQSTSSGLSAGAQISCNQYTCTASTAYAAHVFTNWQAPSSTYTALTLNITSLSGGYLISGTGQTGVACVYYRTTSTGAWTQVRCDSGSGWGKLTDSITLSPSQDLSQLQVAMCVQGDTQDGTRPPPPPSPGFDSMAIFDIWTSAGTNAQAPGTGSSAHSRHNAVMVN